MNALFLIAALAVAFAFGYRFYAKLLALDIFRLQQNYSTPAQTRADARDFVPINRHLLFGHHVAAVAGGVVFAGPVAAAAWGWIPAFLWLVIGTTVAAGTYALGGFWLALSRPGNIDQTASQVLGRQLRPLLFVLAVFVLLVLVSASAALAASLLAAYPGAVLPFWATALVALALGTFLHGRTEFDIVPATLIALTVILLAVWLLGRVPIEFVGTLHITLRDNPIVSFDAVLLWTLLLLLYGFQAARRPVWRMMRPRAFLVALLLALMMLVFYVVFVIEHPTLVAPHFHTPAHGSAPLPWLFLIMSSGAFAGFQLLLLYGVSSRQLRNTADAHYIGYGGALAEGTLAMSALLVAVTAFGSDSEWQRHYAAAPSASDFPLALAFYVEQYATYAAALGLGIDFARQLAVVVVAGLALATVEAGVRTLRHLWAELIPPPAAGAPDGRRYDERTRLWWTFGACVLVALYGGTGLGGLAFWPLLAIASLWLGACGFGVMALALRESQRSVALVWALAGALAALAAWTSTSQLLSWWRAGEWLLFGCAVAVLLLAAGLLTGIARGSLRPPATAPTGGSDS